MQSGLSFPPVDWVGGQLHGSAGGVRRTGDVLGGEVEGRDVQAVFQVEAMGIVPVSRRIEMKLIATKLLGLLEQPAHQGIGMPSAPEGGSRHKIIDIDEVAPHEVVPGPEASHPSGIVPVILERSEQSVPFRTLDLVHPPNELVLRWERRSKLDQSGVGERRLA
jgi:hypothetical protein